MSELFRARCTGGNLIITETTISVELGQIKSESMLRSSLSSVDSKLAVPSLFGLGGGTNLTFIGRGGERLHANLVKPKVAQEIVRLLRG